MVDVVEATISELRAALEKGLTTSEKLVEEYMRRIAAYDRNGIQLNSVIVDNLDALAEARASDSRRRRNQTLGPLDGIPYTAKNSFKVRGLTVAAGSPAFANLVAQQDAFVIEMLRAGGAILLGLTNMPPMANGGMQRGLYGRAESPYNGEYLTSAFASGSSNGSGTATAASFAAFGLGEETWSSGRAPASHNALCAYTPSRGVVSLRGNWPLVPTMDVVVPHTRTMADLLEVLDVIVKEDSSSRGDLWRTQPWVALPRVESVRPRSYPTLRPENETAAHSLLSGLRFGAPKMYIGTDPAAGSGPGGEGQRRGIGGATGQAIRVRPGVIELWERAREDLERTGATVVETDFPVVSRYEGDRPGMPTIATRGLVDPAFLEHELLDLSAWAWDDFLAANGDPSLNRLADVDGEQIFPAPEGALPDRYTGFHDDIATYPEFLRKKGRFPLTAIPHLERGLRGLERSRVLDLEDWMDALGLDAVVFPAVADVAPADADHNLQSADIAWRNGVWVANGNLVPRHLGVPTVTVPMGTIDGIGMPVGLTFAGRAYDDTRLLQIAAAFEQTGPRRTEPVRTPRL
ncbi:amidase [Nesterenkonia natronophila]|uniref:Amidase n=1 Tax=Nesterenkonia natronophila TaxID=2174932 RepID=A0A3A4F276_9MICC|nr:amidase [Nesterenkonia natronophila]RJN32392.1 amidase [Nesterenkonia natronophila]